MKKSIFTFCILLISITISAQNATIKGTLKDSKTLEPLIGVNISIDSLNGTTTDIEGKYEIIVDPTKYNKTKIKFSYIGYEDIIKDITLKADKTEILDIMMGETQSLLDEVVVTSSKFERKIGEESVSIDII